MATTFHIRLALGSLGGVAMLIPTAWAFSFGADAAVNGGRAAGGAGCAQCHPFNVGPGGVEILGAPRRYRADRTYPIGVRVFDADQKGAGFEFSSEVSLGHSGTLLITDALRTQHSDFGLNPNFVTHTSDGVNDSIDHWAAHGGSFQYDLAWQAEAFDDGPVTFFAAGNAVNDAKSFNGDRYYWTYSIAHYAIPGDADADTDLDLFDFVAMQNCFDLDVGEGPDPCPFVDMDDDDAITLADVDLWAEGETMTGPTAPFPGDYVLADATRGGKLYDRWWTVIGASAPVGDHPLYPEIGVQSGSVTFRCKECHGWDYKGVDGQYGAGSHFTGIGGIFDTSLGPHEIFDLLRSDPMSMPNGHDMAALGLSDGDVWDLVKFVSEGVVDTDSFIDETGAFTGEPLFGQGYYESVCSSCHGSDGTRLNFGTPEDPEYVGTLANDNPWELLHKIRFSDPGTPMPATHILGVSDEVLLYLGAYCQTLTQ